MRATAGIDEIPRLRATISGGVAGVAGGLVFGAAMAVFGTLPTIASILHTDSVSGVATT